MRHQTIHASSVAVNNHAVLIAGASGSGKSALAMQLIALGGHLIADDLTRLTMSNELLFASRPPSLPKLIEARGVGLIHPPMVDRGPVALVVDLDDCSKDRMPEPKVVNLLGIEITKWCKVDEIYFPSAVFVYLSNMPVTQAAQVSQ